MERIAIFAALKWECRAVLHPLRQVRRDRLAGFACWIAQTPVREIWLVKTGVGIERAAAAAAALGDLSRFSLLVSTGCSGGLAATLRPGDLAIATAVHGDGGEHPTDDAQRDRLCASAAAAGLTALRGPFLCSATALARAVEKRDAADRGLISVDMEGAPIAARAATAGVPFVAVRAVLDGVDDELLLPERVVDPATGRVRPLALAGHVATHPATIAHLLALQRMQRAARDSLERFFAVWLGSARHG